jgi:DNA invertase Pin-like site-specific DNA recombinase
MPGHALGREHLLHRRLLRKGDVLVVWKLDRLSRSLKDVLNLMEKITQAGAGLRSLTEAIDTTSPGGQMMMQIVGTFAEFERAMLCANARAMVWMRRASKVELVAAAQNSSRINSRRS